VNPLDSLAPFLFSYQSSSPIAVCPNTTDDLHKILNV